MQLAHNPIRRKRSPRLRFKKQQPKPVTAPSRESSNYAADEINAYIAVQNIALAEAEKSMTPVNVERARIANELVENCLRPARPAYAAQHLPEALALAARQRCNEVKTRIALFRTYLETVSRNHVEAA